VGNAVVLGCIPVIVQDNVTEVFEEVRCTTLTRRWGFGSSV
jgi:hypothetical protein